jgi:hypothetical protein
MQVGQEGIVFKSHGDESAIRNVEISDLLSPGSGGVNSQPDLDSGRSDTQAKLEADMQR